MNPHAAIRRNIGIIRDELLSMGLHSDKIENATYSIVTLSRAYLEPVNVIDWRSLYGLTRHEQRIAQVLHKHLGYTVNRGAMLDAMYFDRTDGYSHVNDPVKLMQVYVCKMRKALRNSPYSIENDNGVGYRMVLRPCALALAALQELQAH